MTHLAECDGMEGVTLFKEGTKQLCQSRQQVLANLNNDNGLELGENSVAAMHRRNKVRNTALPCDKQTNRRSQQHPFDISLWQWNFVTQETFRNDLLLTTANLLSSRHRGVGVHSVRSQARRGYNEKRNADQCSPTRGEPHRHR